jgi:hypothetical protein
MEFLFLVNIYKTVLRHISEEDTVHDDLRASLKFHRHMPAIAAYPSSLSNNELEVMSV